MFYSDWVSMCVGQDEIYQCVVNKKLKNKKTIRNVCLWCSFEILYAIYDNNDAELLLFYEKNIKNVPYLL